MTPPVLQYPGSKYLCAPWIVAHMPPHRVYLEPFFGSGAVLFRKPRAPREIVNDLDQRVVTLFRVLREQPDELADLVALTPQSRDEFDAAAEPCDDPLESSRRFLVRSWQAYSAEASVWHIRQPGDTTRGGAWQRLPATLRAVAERLHGVEIERRPALDLIRFADHPDCLIYADPPYILQSRTSGKVYQHEMDDADHIALIGALRAHSGPVLLSGYDSQIYRDRLSDWRCVTRRVNVRSGSQRMEYLWLSPRVQAATQTTFL